MQQVFVQKESLDGETRVAATPETVQRLVKLGAQVVVQTAAGADSCIEDEAYRKAGATIETAATPTAPAIVVRVQTPTVEEARALPAESILLSHVMATQNPEVVNALAEGKIT